MKSAALRRLPRTLLIAAAILAGALTVAVPLQAEAGSTAVVPAAQGANGTNPNTGKTPRKTPAARNSRTMVSIEFDDAYADQWDLRPLLQRYGVPATFFVNSALVNTPGHMSVGQLLALQGDGHEIGGHTRDHRNQPDLNPADQTDDICGDYEQLRAWDLAVSDFAYPNASFSPLTASIVSSCGYRSARTAGGLTAPGACTISACRPAERIPPADPLATLTVPLINPTIPLNALKRYVLNARRYKRGWVQIVFHHVCAGCDPKATPVEYLTRLFQFLRSKEIAPSVRVLRVDSVIALKSRGQ